LCYRNRAPIPCVNNLYGRGAAAGANPARVDLTWTAQAKATSYNMLRGTASGGPYFSDRKYYHHRALAPNRPA
jgi:hypothetical protein